MFKFLKKQISIYIKKISKKFFKNFSFGFSLIEMLVSISLFSFVAIGGISVILGAQRSYKKIAQNRVVIDNLNLVMDTITREVRFGREYNFLDGYATNSIKFISASGATTTYLFNSASSSILEIVNNATNTLSSPAFKVEIFKVEIFGTSTSDTEQPRVKIILAGSINEDEFRANSWIKNQTFYIQSLISQRDIDNITN